MNKLIDLRRQVLIRHMPFCRLRAWTDRGMELIGLLAPLATLSLSVLLLFALVSDSSLFRFLQRHVCKGNEKHLNSSRTLAAAECHSIHCLQLEHESCFGSAEYRNY